MTSVQPPNPPWNELKTPLPHDGYLSFYYSDDMSSLPVRWVTKPGDNKSDPNIETCTYGVFSTCSPQMRRGVVNQGRPLIFFFTRRGESRVLTGYYKIRWYACGPLGTADLCLAAEKCHFVKNPLSLVDVDGRLGTNLSAPFRGFRIVSPEHSRRLIGVLHRQRDASADYVAEIDRLERFNLKHGGFRYISWKQPGKFDWDYAGNYLATRPVTPTLRPTSSPNASPTGFWRCTACSQRVKNKALLKRCPNCGGLGTLQPHAE